MSSKEPPSSPPEGKWCALCEREITDEVESVELRTRALVCMRCWKAQPRRGRTGMGSQSRKHRGYESQRIVAAYLREHGWPYAEPTGAGRSGSDVIGVLDIDVEVKARRGFDPAALMRQQEMRLGQALPFGVLRLDGQGPASIGSWPVVIRLDLFVELLRAAGYGGSDE